VLEPIIVRTISQNVVTIALRGLPAPFQGASMILTLPWVALAKPRVTHDVMKTVPPLCTCE